MRDSAGSEGPGWRPGMVSASRRQVRRLQRFVPGSQGGVLILAYHLVGAESGSAVDIPLSTFKRQLAELRDHARIVSLRRALEILNGREECEGTAVVLTFDDAYENFYTHAFPVLSAMELPSTLYVPVDFIEGSGIPPIRGTNGFAGCSWSQLEELVKAGSVTIGSHTCSHPNLRLISFDEADRELDESRRRLELGLSVTVDSFCYPQGQWSKKLEALVRDHYRTAVIGGGARLYPSRWSPLRLARLPIKSDMPESLLPILDSSLWIEEWIADRVRRRLR